VVVTHGNSSCAMGKAYCGNCRGDYYGVYNIAARAARAWDEPGKRCSTRLGTAHPSIEGFDRVADVKYY